MDFYNYYQDIISDLLQDKTRSRFDQVESELPAIWEKFNDGVGSGLYKTMYNINFNPTSDDERMKNLIFIAYLYIIHKEHIILPRDVGYLPLANGIDTSLNKHIYPEIKDYLYDKHKLDLNFRYKLIRYMFANKPSFIEDVAHIARCVAHMLICWDNVGFTGVDFAKLDFENRTFTPAEEPTDYFSAADINSAKAMIQSGLDMFSPEELNDDVIIVQSTAFTEETIEWSAELIDKLWRLAPVTWKEEATETNNLTDILKRVKKMDPTIR